MVPTKIAIDDLSHLEKQLPNLVLKLAFGNADKDIDRKIALHRRQFVRLVDKALDEYHEARNMIVSQVREGERTTEEMTRTGRGIYMFKFIDHIENCISTVRRILRYLAYLKGNQDGLQIPRIARRQIDSVSSALVAVRDAIEHMDERIQNSKIADNEPVMIKLIDSQDGIVLCCEVLKFNSLSSLLKKLHELSKEMTAWSVEPESA